MNSVYSQITEALSQADAVNIQKSKEWAIQRYELLKAFRSSDECKAMRSNAYALYEKLHSVAGGKTWFSQMTNGNKETLLAFVEKNAKVTSEKRNAKIATQLEKVGITEVISAQINWNKDGFDGSFTVITDKGEKCVKVETIYAGGYNIQCFHLRVLVKIK